MNFREISLWLERKCQADRCMNISIRGYIYCENHLYGFPSALPNEVIEYLRERNTCYFPLWRKNIYEIGEKFFG